MGTFPYLAADTESRPPVTGVVFGSGGTVEADAAARAGGRPKF